MVKNATSFLIAFALLTGLACAQVPAVPDTEALVALLRAQKYGELDARLGAYQSAYEASSEREWDLVIVIAGFERIEPELEARFSAWTQAHPRSYVALLARAAYSHQLAWSARGGRYGGKTANERMQAMRRYFEQSDADLRASLALSPRPQLSHRYLVSSAMARSDGKQMSEAYQAALRADPDSYASRRAYLNAFRLEWGGSLEAMQKVVDHTGAFPPTPKLVAVARKLKASLLGHRALLAERSKDTSTALELYARGLAEAEDAVLLLNRGRLLAQLKREDEAFRDFDRALALDPSLGEALEQRGMSHERRKRIKEAVADYRLAASYGQEWSIQKLGIMHLGGGGIPPNDAEAARWLRIGADLGDDRAQMGLGYMYSAGRGMAQDPRKAYDLWRLSAAQGNKEAQKYLDEMPWYWKARFTAQDWFAR